MIPLKNNSNVDNSNLVDYPDGRIKDNTGSGNGTPVNRNVYGDLHSNISRMMRLYNITPNDLPDNETNGYQIIEAIIALASKNDFIMPITSASGVLNVGLKIGSMLVDEQVVCKATIDFTTETQIKGSDNISIALNVQGSFKANEYVRLIKTVSGITLVRLADNASLDSMASSLNYLKKASQSDEDAGVIDTKATTPLVNKTTFTKRVNGVDSTNYLAIATGSPGAKNGLFSSDEKKKLAKIKEVRNIGYFGGFDIGPNPGISLLVGGDCVSANMASQPPGGEDAFITVTIPNAMDNTNYKVRLDIESLGLLGSDNDISGIVFKVLSTTQFQVGLLELFNTVQSIKIHFETIQL